jgi:hypothetical protein
MGVLLFRWKGLWLGFALGIVLGFVVGVLKSSGGEPVKGMITENSTPVFYPLPGRTVGVVILEPQALLAIEHRNGPPGVACFSSRGGSYRWFYVPAKDPSTGETQRFGTIGSEAKGVKIDGLVIATQRTLAPFGITKPYSLVEVIVNKGEGSGPEGSFAASDAKILDGTKDYPLKVAEIIQRSDGRYQSQLRQNKSVAIQLEKARAEAAASDKEAANAKEIKKTTANWVYITWLADKGRLRIVFHTRIVEEVPLFGKGTEPVGPGGPGGGRGLPNPLLPGQGRSYGPQWGMETGMIYEFTKSGEEVSGESLPPKRFVKKTGPPPPQARR